MPIVTCEVTDVGSLIKTAKQVCVGFGRATFWYRGHARSDWTLVPSVHRSYDGVGENDLTARFRLLAPTRYARCPEMGDFAGWLTLMQHYGLPTRLLDWTGSLLAAAFFAVSDDPKPGAGAIWALLPQKLNQASSKNSTDIFFLGGDQCRDLLGAAFFDNKLMHWREEDAVAVHGQDLDLRMSVQLGAYTLHATDASLENRAGAEQYLVKFLIPEDAKPTLQEELWALGIRRSVLFPDLGNLAADLRTDFRLVSKKTLPT